MSRLILLEFDEINLPKYYQGTLRRLKFVSRRPYVPKREVSLDTQRIYAIYKADKYYVVYETENINFYRYYMTPQLPNNAELIVPTYYIKVCADCGSTRIFEDSDEEICEACGSENITSKRIEAYKPREFNWGNVIRGSFNPETEGLDSPIVTPDNLAYYTSLIASRVFGINIKPEDVRLANSRNFRIVRLKTLKEYRINNAEFVLIVGVPRWTYYDEPDEYGVLGVYIKAYCRSLEPFRCNVAWVKARDVTREDLEGVNPERLLEYVDVDILVRFGLLEKCLDYIVEELSNGGYPPIPEKIKEYDLETYEGLVEARETLRLLDAVDRIREIVERREYTITSVANYLKEAENNPIAREYCLLTAGCTPLQLLERYEQMLEELRREEMRRELRKLLRSIPSWADGVARLSGYTVVPVKFSGHSRNEVYYGKHWRKRECITDYLSADTVVLRNGRAFRVEKVRESDKYVTLRFTEEIRI